MNSVDKMFFNVVVFAVLMVPGEVTLGMIM